ncbi:DUF6221 family protein [Nonomuraea wenchangensis]
MTSDMLSWTRQQIEHRKALAEEAHGASWEVCERLEERSDGGGDDVVALLDSEDWTVLVGFTVPGEGADEDDIKHMAFNDPQQIIADCKADMAILEECEKYFGGELHELMWHASNLAHRVVADLAKAYGWTPERTTSCPS